MIKERLSALKERVENQRSPKVIRSSTPVSIAPERVTSFAKNLPETPVFEQIVQPRNRGIVRDLAELPSPPKKRKIEFSKITNCEEIVEAFSPLKKMSFTNQYLNPYKP